MSVFDFLFIKEPVKPSDPPSYTVKNEPERLDVVPGMQLDVMQENGQQLLSGVVLSINFPRELVLDRLPGGLSFPVCPEGTPVQVNGYTRKTIPFHLTATIQESTRIICKLTDLELKHYDEGRQNFRLPLNTDVSLFYEHDKYMENAEHCKLVDISTGGACFESEYIHAVGEVLRMRTQISDYAPMTFLGEIIRVEEIKNGLFRYGFLFAKLKEDEITNLTRTLYNMQSGNKAEWSRHGFGQWG